MKINLFLAILIAASLASEKKSHSHDAWIEIAGAPAHPVIYADKTPEPYPGAKVKTVKAYDRNQDSLAVHVDRKAEPAEVLVKGNPAVLTLFFDNGYWQKIGDDYKELTRKERSPKADTMRTVKLAKTILAWPAWVRRPLGMTMEIVPEELKPDKRMVLRVLYEGKPLAGATLESRGYKTPAVTDQEGRTEVTLDPGAQRFSVEHVDPKRSNSRIGSTSLTAVLIFEVEKSAP